MTRGKYVTLCLLIFLMSVLAGGCSESEESTADGDSETGGDQPADGDENVDGDSDGQPDGDDESVTDGDGEGLPDGDVELSEENGDGEASEEADGDDTEGDIDNEIDPDDIGDPEYDQNPDSVNLRGACPAETRVGGFKVEMNENMGYTAIDGVVKNGVIPKDVPEVAVEDGDCKLLRKRRLVCNPTCQPGYTCDYDLNCISIPVGQDAGTLVFRGLVKTVVLQPIYPTNTYSYNKLNHPGFAENTVIQVASSEGYFGEIEMFGVGVSQLVTSTDKWTINEGEPLIISWTAPEEGARSRVVVQINIDQHGLTPLTLICDFPDTGEATVSATLINQLTSAGVTGYPSGTVVRRTMDSMTSDEECIDFMISSVRTINIEVAGHIPCTSDEDCPDELDCNELIQQCQ